MVDMVRISGIALLGAIGSVILKEKHKLAAIGCAMCAFFTVILICFKGSFLTSVTGIISLCNESALFEYAVILLRALCISYIASLTSSLCREADEPLIGGAVELFAKGELLALSIPLLGDLMGLAGELMGR